MLYLSLRLHCCQSLSLRYPPWKWNIYATYTTFGDENIFQHHLNICQVYVKYMSDIFWQIYIYIYRIYVKYILNIKLLEKIYFLHFIHFFLFFSVWDMSNTIESLSAMTCFSYQYQSVRYTEWFTIEIGRLKVTFMDNVYAQTHVAAREAFDWSKLIVTNCHSLHRDIFTTLTWLLNARAAT